MEDLEGWVTNQQQKTYAGRQLGTFSEKLPLLPNKDNSKGMNKSFRNVASTDILNGELSQEELHAKKYGLQDPAKTIDYMGSLSLTLNNVIGPGMMSLPHVFQTAGVLPTAICIILCSAGSSLVATFLADAISSIPGNSNFEHNVELGTAFRKIIGEEAYIIAEVLFLISCFVQACAGLVEASQGLDGFLSSFVMGSTYGFQFYPTPKFVSWSGEACEEDMNEMAEYEKESQALGDTDLTALHHNPMYMELEAASALHCTPFAESGSLVLTLGFLISTAMFFPLSRGFLKEIIWVQIIVVVVSFALLFQFSAEFMRKGLTVDIPWVGTEFDRLTGVVLFNFAFSITIPTWLKEKKHDVDVNAVIWPATTASSVCYIVFGCMAAMAFPDVDTEVLKDLASPQVHYLTRIAAAIFGVTIIGAGVPVFCVMIKGALYSNRVFSPEMAFFFGAVFPYLVSWTLYQGNTLVSIVNWTGLLVNGTIAFILPLLLVLNTFKARKRRQKRDLELSQQNQQVTERDGKDTYTDGTDEDLTSTPVDEEFAEEGSVHPLPAFLVSYRKHIALGLLFMFFIGIISTIILDISSGVDN